MKLFVAIAGHATLLPRFLEHYSYAGVTRFFISTDAAVAADVLQAVDGFPVTLVTELDSLESIEGGTAAVTKMRMEFADPDEWVVLTDLDEFQIHPRGVAASAAAADAEGANVVRGWMVDRVATDGELKPINPDSDLDALFPERCYVTALLQGGLSYKCALVKGHLESFRNEAGQSLAHHHMAGERIASETIDIQHFKWNAEAVDRITLAIARTKAAAQPFWIEYERVLEHLHTHGRLRWQDYADRRKINPFG